MTVKLLFVLFLLWKSAASFRGTPRTQKDAGNALRRYAAAIKCDATGEPK